MAQIDFEEEFFPETIIECRELLNEMHEEIQRIKDQVEEYDEGRGPLRDITWRGRAKSAMRAKWKDACNLRAHMDDLERREQERRKRENIERDAQIKADALARKAALKMENVVASERKAKAALHVAVARLRELLSQEEMDALFYEMRLAEDRA